MAGSDGEKPEPGANDKSEREAKQPPDQQNWKPVIIHVGGGGGITGGLYAVSRLFGEPYDGWVIALGLVTAIITTAFVFHDFYPKNGSAIRSFAGFAILLVLLGIAAWTRFIWEKQEGPSAPEPFHVTQGATISAEYAGITSPLVAMVSGLGNTIIAVHLIAFFTIENTQSVPATIESYSLEGSASSNGPWRKLCPISLEGASVYTFTAPPPSGGIQDVVPLDFSNNSLEKRLVGR